MQNKQKHLEFIQNVINRMAGNLFFLKGWAVTLIVGLFALSTNESDTKFALLAYLPVIVFWFLDGYFLSQERLYRDLYSDVSSLKEKDIDFSMNTEKYKAYSKNTWISAVFSSTLLMFYLSLIISMTFLKFFIVDSNNRNYQFWNAPHKEQQKSSQKMMEFKMNYEDYCKHKTKTEDNMRSIKY